MKKATLIALLTATSFCFGFAFKTLITQQKTTKMRKVTGIGGIFFKCKDPKKVVEWYQQHLGLNTNPYGATFEWYDGSDSTKKGVTQWSPFSETTKYFEPSTRDFMINYRVENLVELVEQLQSEGVTVVDKIETVEYGKFVHIIDLEGNKIELWEPTEKK
jgi:predicted enzyme related to lactoylglutathione lyase